MSTNAILSPAPRLLVPLGALLALCGISYLSVAIAGQSAIPILPTLMKLTILALWVAIAMRFRSAVAPLRANPGPHQECALLAIAATTERLKIKIRMLETMIEHENWMLDKSEALKELQEILADLETQQCKI